VSIAGSNQRKLAIRVGSRNPARNLQTLGRKSRRSIAPGIHARDKKKFHHMWISNPRVSSQTQASAGVHPSRLAVRFCATPVDCTQLGHPRAAECRHEIRAIAFASTATNGALFPRMKRRVAQGDRRRTRDDQSPRTLKEARPEKKALFARRTLIGCSERHLVHRVGSAHQGR